MPAEFELIDRYFRRAVRRPGTRIGIGDDAAVIQPPSDSDLVVAVDTLVAGRHFPPGTPPKALGHKALAVNLSDLAAMGAQPAWATLALTLERADDGWLQAFASGFFELADRFGVELVGGDTTQGPLTLSVQVMGCLPRGEGLLRRGAGPGDEIWVTGTLGDAALYLKSLGSGEAIGEQIRRRLDYPEPRVDVGLALRNLATSAIDISDGLMADLGHLLAASGVGAELQVVDLPLSDSVRDYVTRSGDWAVPLSGGDDYELCFTAPASRQAEISERLAEFCAARVIGQVSARAGQRWVGPTGFVVPEQGGYQHFV
ncbi:MAG: thiamine-phosphate kinase [Gammaproteobacteria bacterium]|nr:thiamine-phosphate kinase [Gammaproteobacteria bacterium]